MDEKNETFRYSYSTAQQEEIRRIREKYAPGTPPEDALERLHRLDAGAARGAGRAALTLGIISALVMGVGMCCTMLWQDKLFIPGVIIGLAGIAGVLAAYPLYARMLKKKREELAPEILRLTDELLK